MDPEDSHCWVCALNYYSSWFQKHETEIVIVFSSVLWHNWVKQLLEQEKMLGGLDFVLLGLIGSQSFSNCCDLVWVTGCWIVGPPSRRCKSSEKRCSCEGTVMILIKEDISFFDKHCNILFKNNYQFWFHCDLKQSFCCRKHFKDIFLNFCLINTCRFNVKSGS